MKALLTVTAAALCFSQVQPAVAGEEPVGRVLAADQIRVQEETASFRPQPTRQEALAEAPWEQGHRMALVVARHESRRPAFDVSAAVAFLANAN